MNKYKFVMKDVLRNAFCRLVFEKCNIEITKDMHDSGSWAILHIFLQISMFTHTVNAKV